MSLKRYATKEPNMTFKTEFGNLVKADELEKLLESCNPEDDIIFKDKIFDKKIRVGFKVGYVTLKDKLLALLEDKDRAMKNE